MYNKVFLFFLALSALSACQTTESSKEAQITLSGKVNNPMEGVVLLEDYEQREIKVIDTIEINDDGTFSHGLNGITPGYYRLNFYNRQQVNLILTDKDLNMEVDGNGPRGVAVVTGSQEMEDLQALTKLQQDFQLTVAKINQQFTQANAQGDQAQMEQLRGQFVTINTQHKQDIKQKVTSMGNSLAILNVIGAFTVEEDFALLDSLGNIFAANPPDEEHTPQFLAFIEQARQQYKSLSKVEIGKIAPEINLPDPDGNLVSLSSLRGKVVLIDFWAQWCKPCRMENPNIVAAYNQYQDQGFEVYGVSLDRTKEQWVRGIEEDGLRWTQVSDLQYWSSEAAQAYGVKAIPASFLLDREGKIIAKNLRGPALQAKLKEVLG